MRVIGQRHRFSGDESKVGGGRFFVSVVLSDPSGRLRKRSKSDLVGKMSKACAIASRG